MELKRNLRGGQLLAMALHEKGVKHVFTLAGGFCNPALEGFMDCQMPVMDGFQALKVIRHWESEQRREGDDRIPIIGITAYARRV